MKIWVVTATFDYDTWSEVYMSRGGAYRSARNHFEISDEVLDRELPEFINNKLMLSSHWKAFEIDEHEIPDASASNSLWELLTIAAVCVMAGAVLLLLC